MMFTTTMTPTQLYKKQLQWMMRTYFSASVGTILLFQVVGLFFKTTQYSSDEESSIAVVSQSFDFNLIMIFIWSFAINAILANKLTERLMFRFISTKRVHHLANVTFSVTQMMIGSFIPLLFISFAPLLKMFSEDTIIMAYPFLIEDPLLYGSLWLRVFGYSLIAGSLSYFIVSFYRYSAKLFFITAGILFILQIMNLPAMFIIYLFESATDVEQFGKGMVVAVVLYTVSYLFRKRTEVRS